MRRPTTTNRWASALFWAGLLLLFVSGCGGGGGDEAIVSSSQPTSTTTTPNSGVGTLVFEFTNAQSAGVPSGTTQLKFEFFDEFKNLLVTVDKPFDTRVVVENVPTNATSVRITAYDDRLDHLATLEANINVVGGGTTTVDLSNALVSLPGPAKWDVPVLVVRYFPTNDGQNIDSSVATRVSGTIEEIRQKTVTLTIETMLALENASRYHYYNDPQAPRSLNYFVEDTIEYLEPVPVSSEKTFGDNPVFDYEAIMSRVDIQTYVEQRGVKEVWIWGYHPEDVTLWESNFSSTEGDLSNSNRDDTDLPILNSSYTVYHYNYQLGTAEAVHNHGHQIEAIMRHYGGELWQSFEGEPGNWRCGNVHFPPNGEFDYDYANPKIVQSDIEDWKPEGLGQLKPINSEAWGSSHLGWLVYWMQSIPGDNNGLAYQGKTLTDWWSFIGNFDEVVSNGANLAE